MINNDQHVKRIQNNRHGLNEYYLRHDGDKTIYRENVWSKKRSVTYMGVATLAAITLLLLIYRCLP